ncbi:thermostable hemolysin [Microbulbifer rhizosphaerae]|uniref:Thermostable hemolysin n=1 Tax=Microbulbifer rhizosphaerae TaxID=1562603 RepID=A0A7W4WE92_9GAMM|nr:thermostable hemolysin [Microbulbifer rhizosphaerae]MBB3061941.1 hypothetical protein [Microbulbifer rhizosphaerae]
MQIKLIDSSMRDWSAAVALVKNKYRAHFDADIEPAPDYFAVYYDSFNQVKACGGITVAKPVEFFSEQYLNLPIEIMLSEIEQKPIYRDDIVEVGSLASLSRQAGSELMMLIPLLVWCKGKKYILCTATSQLSRLLARLGIPFVPLQQAYGERLRGEDPLRWGNYYQNKPATGYINVCEMSGIFLANAGRYGFRNLEIDVYPEVRKSA